ncbi:hypothetical protein JHL17_11830 [Azospirillum sp. YIM B02556]|uniref:Methyl-accepting chemotaxis protein n=1 Tax=Azospirillum endophyticum TaxID=2800326 RepID=A0ABS1F3U9_9PROT|nr:hypothetical protein [Azospirillum endophyticum]MBK1838104.1 hypothetical protein [Azospirillum endophyticum]
MTAIVQQNERIAEDVKTVVSEVRSLTQLVIKSLKQTAQSWTASPFPMWARSGGLGLLRVRADTA